MYDAHLVNVLPCHRSPSPNLRRAHQCSELAYQEDSGDRVCVARRRFQTCKPSNCLLIRPFLNLCAQVILKPKPLLVPVQRTHIVTRILTLPRSNPAIAYSLVAS